MLQELKNVITNEWQNMREAHKDMLDIMPEQFEKRLRNATQANGRHFEYE